MGSLLAQNLSHQTSYLEVDVYADLLAELILRET